MSDVLTLKNREKALDYFRARLEYFWKWADNGEVVEWRNGATITYREDLQKILTALYPQGIPPLGSILLALSACHSEWKNHSKGVVEVFERIINNLSQTQLHPSQKEDLLGTVKNAVAFLDVISSLPAKYHIGEYKIMLLQTIFWGSPKKFSEKSEKNLVNEFISGNLDEAIAETKFILNVQRIKADLDPLVVAGKYYPTAAELELKMRIGVTEIPEPAETELPDQKTPDLLELLAEDSKTVGITRLTQRLIAALNIPMHSKGISDQSYGGVSDISNRGNFDRLLLSELAHDDISLMARLANNEALYLRREELPSNLDLKRNILLDTTIKMWGTPRLFAIAAALACSQKKKPNTEVTSFALSGNRYQPIDLDTKNGVINAMEQLDSALHCGNGLKAFLEEQPPKGKTENFLITEEESDESPEFHATIADLKKTLNYLITVNRNGDLHFYEFIKGSRKLISSTKFELEELLFNAKPTVKKVKSSKNAPAIVSCDPFPLLYPTSKIRMSARNTFDAAPFGVIGITLDQRVLHWPFKGRGAWEIIDVIEKGDYCFGSDGTALIFILVKNDENNLLKLYQYDRQSIEVKTFDFSGKINKPETMEFNSMQFMVANSGGFITINPTEGTIIEKVDMTKVKAGAGKGASVINFNNIKKHINNGYSVLNTVKSVFVNSNGNLAFDQRQISITANKNLSIVANSNGNLKVNHAHHIETVSLDALANNFIKFSKFGWNDGSEAWVDSRGFVHLRSSDKNLPEITIVLIVGRETAGWTSDGKVFGSSYFIGENNPDAIPVPDFLVNYLQRFLDILQ